MKAKYIITTVILGLSIMSCEKWTTPQPKHSLNLVETNKTDEYYQKLREFKQNKDKRIAFGWFGNWTGVGSSLQASMAGLPDSVDFVSIWGPWFNPTEAMIKDFHQTRALKGTKALACDLIFDIGGKLNPPIPDTIKNPIDRENFIYNYWGWSRERTPEGQKKREEAVAKYANAICDIIDKYDYDGFDIDAEPSYGQPFQTKKELWEIGMPEDQQTLMPVFIETMGKRIGPMAETEKGRQKLFVIDGEPEAVHSKYGKYFNYFIFQAYGDGSEPREYRLRTLIDHFGGDPKDGKLTEEEIVKKTIFTCDFESGAANGGNPVGQILGFAMYKWTTADGKQIPCGGIGSYHMEYEYNATVPNEVTLWKLDLSVWNYTPIAKFNMTDVQGTTYPWLRKAIRIMNEPKK